MKTPAKSNNWTVFVVEDDLGVRESLKAVLQAVGLSVRCFASADEFLANHDGTRPDCLLLDVRMPGTSGLELQQKLADDLDIPIIFMTGHGNIPMNVQAMQNGAIEFLEKPCPPENLINAIRKVIDLEP